MKNLSPEFCKSVKSARREAGLTQGQLAAEVGCKQSALSMFEQGDGTKLNDEVIEKLAKKFNLSLSPSASPAKVNTLPLPHSSTPPLLRGFCPNPHCPTNKEYFVEEIRLFLPDRETADPVGGKYCAMCGELLERKCPNCGAAIHAGAICSLCGQPYVVIAE
ncbi:MAG: helix-turn-helix domain-containing protein [Kiritimatiellae bacterium]|nr:helix-turn-helix domain-containing protein [Kiritimatiellia bacterium]